MDEASVTARKFLPDFKNIRRISTGSINETYVVSSGKSRYVLQKMSPIFKPSLIFDIDMVTKRLLERGIQTPLLIKTISGKDFYLGKRGAWWRMMTYVPGVTLEKKPSLAEVKTACRLVGKFHSALLNSKYNFKHRLSHFHDTRFYLSKLKKVFNQKIKGSKLLSLKEISEEIIKEAELLKDLSFLPKRIIHGDLKISNVRFDKKGRAISLIDLDTLMMGNIAIELGDAFRSWCSSGEDDPAQKFNLDLYFAGLEAYKKNASFLRADEEKMIPEGIKTIILELAARFTIDALEEKYFIWDSSRYPSLHEQNKRKALSQLSLFRAVKSLKL